MSFPWTEVFKHNEFLTGMELFSLIPSFLHISSGGQVKINKTIQFGEEGFFTDFHSFLELGVLAVHTFWCIPWRVKVSNS